MFNYSFEPFLESLTKRQHLSILCAIASIISSRRIIRVRPITIVNAIISMLNRRIDGRAECYTVSHWMRFRRANSRNYTIAYSRTDAYEQMRRKSIHVRAMLSLSYYY